MATDLYRAALDAIPSFILILDKDLRILDHNVAAGLLLSAPGEAGVRFYRAGHALHCVHAQEASGGCGAAPACRTCVVRDSVSTCLREGRVVRERTTFAREGQDPLHEIWFMVTAAPFEHDGSKVALLTLEDISELTMLRSIVPLCAWCRRVRTGLDYWQSVERFVTTNMAVDWSHAICTECLEKQLQAIEPGSVPGGSKP